eukprot:gene18450-37381_t
MERKIRVLLADDHPIVMTGFAMSLESHGMEVAGQARTPADAIAQFGALQPDVLVLDIRFGEELTGLDVAKQVLAQAPAARIVFLSQFDQDSLIKETYRLGGRAFLTKDCDPADLAAAVRRAHEGGLYFPPQIAERLAQLSVQGEQSPQAQLDETLVLRAARRRQTEAVSSRVLGDVQRLVGRLHQRLGAQVGVSRAGGGQADADGQAAFAV